MGVNWRVLWLICCWGVALPAQTVPGVPQGTTGAAPRLVEIPTPTLSLTPELLRETTPVTWADYQRAKALWERKLVTPAPVALEQAVYEAELQHDRLHAGTFDWQIRHLGDTPRFWSPTGLGVPISGVKWADRPALWGWAAHSGTTIFLDQSGPAALRGEWSVTGKPYLRQVEFSLSFPPAVVSRLRLRTAPDVRITAGPFAVRNLPGDSTQRIWEIDLGNASRCVLQCHTGAETALPEATPVLQQETVYSLRPEGLRLRADWRLEILQRPLSKLEFEVDSELELVSVSLGNDVPLPWQATPGTGFTRIVVPLVDPLTGTDSIIRLRAVAPLRTESDWTLPAIRLPRSILEAGTTSVVVTPPLQITRLRPSGLRQTAVELTSQREDLWTFKQFRSDGTLQLMLGTPRPRLAARVISDVQLENRDWQSVTQLQVTAAEGSAYTIPCRVPAGWEVINVDGRGEVALDWNLAAQANGEQQLILQFLEAIAPGAPVTVEIQARRTPVAPNLQTPVPAFEPLDVDELQMLLSVSSSGTDVRPTLELATAFDQLDLSELSSTWTQTEFWQTRLSKRTPTPQLWQLTGTLPEGHFSLQTLQTPVQVGVKVRTELSAEVTLETAQIAITPEHGRVERVLVYFSESGPPWTWKLTGKQATATVDARRLPLARHAAWDLPPTGELWSVQLAQPIAEAFTIEVQRTRGGVPKGRLGTLFVPQAARFEGQYQVQVTPGLIVDFQPQGMEAVVQPAPLNETVAGAWSWQQAVSALEFQIRQLPTSRIAPVMRQVTIRQRWASSPDEPDEYHVLCRLGAGFSGHVLECRLPEAAQAIEVRVDQNPVPVVRENAADPLQLAALRDDQTLELRYRMPTQTSSGPQWKEVLLPQFSIPVLQADFEFLVPPGWELGAEPAGLRFKVEQGSLPWLQRLFGPLGQLREFPELWRGVLTEPVAPRSSDSDFSDELWKSRQSWRASSAVLPDRLSLWIWPTRYVTLGSWLGVWTLGLFGVIARVGCWPGRRLWGAVLFGVLLCLAIAFPVAPAKIVGGCVSGLLLSVLLPRRILSRWMLSEEPAQHVHVPSGSTHSFPIARPLVLVFALGTAGLAVPVRAQTGALPSEIRVLLPTSSTSSTTPPPIVYVPQKWWESVQPLLYPESVARPALFQQANYEVTAAADQSLSVIARYTVLVPPLPSTQLVEFPGGPWNLDAQQPCLVDGQPRPVLTRPGSTALWVSLPPFHVKRAAPPETVPIPADVAVDTPITVTFAAETEAPAEVTAPVAGPTLPPVAPEVYRTITVEFRGYLTTQGQGDGLHVDWALPGFPSARMQLANQHPAQLWQLVQEDQPTQTIRPQESAVFEIGLSPAIRLQTTTSSRPVAVKMDAVQQTLVDVQPGIVQLKQRILYRVMEGRVSAVSWELPPGVVIRSLNNPELRYQTLLPNPDGSQLLTLEFERPQTGNFAINAELLVTNHGLAQQVVVPSVELIENDGITPLRPTAHYLGVRTSPEFQLDAPLEVGEQIKSLTIDQFVGQWGPLAQRPRLAFQLLDPVPVTLGLKQLQPQRVVRRLEFLGQLESRRLLWQATATVEVQNSPAFGHVLDVDPRWVITQITVKEDNADRLLRWTRLGNQVQIYLRDRTSGTQTIQLTGTVPLQVPQEVALPTLTFQGATVGEARLQLFQDPDVAVELVEANRWQVATDSADLRPPQARSLLLGRYVWPLEAPPLVVRTGQNEPLVDYDQVSILQPREGRWRWTSALIFHVRQGHGSQFLVSLPTELSQARVTAPNVRQFQEVDADGSRLISLLPQQAVAGDFVVQVTGELSAPLTGSWVLPEIRSMNATPREHYLLLGDKQLAVGEPVLSGLIPGRLPSELSKWLGAETALADYRHFLSVSRPWSVSLPAALSQQLQPEIVWADTQLWLTGDGIVRGRTQWYLGPQEAEQVQIEIPPGATPQAALVDGEFALTTIPAPERVSVPLSFPQGGHILTLHWQQTFVPETDWWQRWEVVLPRLVGLSETTHAICWTPPSGMRALSQNGEAVSRRIWSLREAVAVTRALDQRFSTGRIPLDPISARLSHEIHESGEQALKERPAGTHPEPEEEQLAELTPRLQAAWQALRDAGELDLTLLSPASDGERLLAQPMIGRRGRAVVLTGPQLPAVLKLTLVDDRLWDWSWAGLIGLSLIVLLWKFSRNPVVEWLGVHPAVGWLVLGIVWWLFFRPTWIALLCWAVGLLTGSQVIRRPARQEVVVTSK